MNKDAERKIAANFTVARASMHRARARLVVNVVATVARIRSVHERARAHAVETKRRTLGALRC